MTRLAMVAAVLTMLAAGVQQPCQRRRRWWWCRWRWRRRRWRRCRWRRRCRETGLDRSKPISSVTEAEKNTLCDWFAPMLGGYGAPQASRWP